MELSDSKEQEVHCHEGYVDDLKQKGPQCTYDLNDPLNEKAVINC